MSVVLTEIRRDYVSVTEQPGIGATHEQLDMLRTRYELARSLAEGKDAIEIACGTGTGLGYIARTARSLVAGDIDPSNVAVARRHYGERLQIDEMDAACLPFPDASFDAAFLLETIYYLPDPLAGAREALRVLRPGGTFLIVSANRESSVFNPSPFTHRYFSADELKSLLKEAGFRSVEVQIGFPVAHESGLFQSLRRLAVRCGLIPRTMTGKEKLKRMLFGPLPPIPAEADETTGSLQPLTLAQDGPVHDHKVLYAIGRKDA